MQLFLVPQCTSFTGSLGNDYGYAVQKRKNGFYGCRNTRGLVPPDGHWRFILACAELAKCGLYLTDIQITWNELQTALYEAHLFVASEHVGRNGRDYKKLSYKAADILNLKTTFDL